MTPIISVIIPTFNRRQVLGRAIQSVLDQSMADFELIVVDDGSDDGTADFLDDFHDRRLRTIFQHNAGVCAARNSGVAASSSGFVTFLDSDDEAHPDWLQFYSDAVTGGFRLASCAALFVGPGSQRKLVLPENSDRAFGRIHARFLAGAFGVDKDLLLAVGGFREGLQHSEHTDLALRLGGQMLDDPFRYRYINDPLVTMHRDERPYNPNLQFETAMTLLREDLVHLQRSRKMHATYAAIAGVAASKLGRHAEARRLLAMAVRVNPFGVKNYLRLGRQVAFRR